MQSTSANATLRTVHPPDSRGIIATEDERLATEILLLKVIVIVSMKMFSECIDLWRSVLVE
jgi:hypothetical protein